MTTPTPAQQLEEVLARVDAGVAGYGLDAADFLILNARLLHRALAALEAVEAAEDCMCSDCNGDGVWHLEPCGYCNGHGNFKMVPAPKTADAVEVSRG